MTVREISGLRHSPEKVVAFVKRLIDGYDNPSKSERRSQSRRSIAIPVVVQPLDDKFHAVGDSFSAVTKDISGGGVGLWHSVAVSAEYLQIEFTTCDQERMALLAQVKHCTPCNQFYYIGGRFVVDWSLCDTSR